LQWMLPLLLLSLAAPVCQMIYAFHPFCRRRFRCNKTSKQLQMQLQPGGNVAIATTLNVIFLLNASRVALFVKKNGALCCQFLFVVVEPLNSR